MIYAFGDYEWDEELFELRSTTETIAAPPRVLETIGYLIRHRARAVTKEELRQNVWKGTAVVDGALNQKGPETSELRFTALSCFTQACPQIADEMTAFVRTCESGKPPTPECTTAIAALNAAECG